MSLSINNTTATSGAQTLPPTSPERQAFAALAKSLRSGDLSGAKSAYAEMVKNAPEGASIKPGSPFAQLGKALQQGDVDAARAAFANMVHGAIGKGGGTTPPPGVPVASSTGGTAGSTLNAVA